MRRAWWKRKNVRDELTIEAANSPIRRSSRYGLPPKSGNLLPAALKVRKEPSASPHLEAGYLPGCKPERLSATVPCVPLRYALPGATCERQRKEGQRVSCLEHRYAADFLVRGRTDLRFEYSAAGRGVSSLVGSAWRPTSVLGELTDKAVNSSLTFFLFHRARRIFFLMSQKENAGCIPTVKPCILVPQSGTMLHPCGGSPRPLLEQRKSRRHSNGQSPF